MAQMQQCCIKEILPKPCYAPDVDLRALAMTFGLIFVAELPDKTAYTVLLLSARGRPLPVLLGASTAFLIHGFIALAIGSALARLPEGVIRWTAAGVFALVGVLLLVRKKGDDAPQPPSTQQRAYFRALALVFVAEMGDATQIGTAALVARMPASRWSVFVGATLALWTFAALAVLVGKALGERVPRRVLRKAAGVIFIVFGVGSALFA